jgi:hypothetical protein
MKRTIFHLLHISLLAILFCGVSIVGASELFTLKGRVVDGDGKPVEGGEIFVYNTSQTRRPADFISPKSGRDGDYRTEIPAGRYWVVARVRSGAGYGPLAIGKRHSGEAREIEGDAGSEVVLDFIVADVREMARSQRKTGDDYRKVEGRILDREGKPVQGAYAFARGEKNKTGLPDFMSPKSDADGSYTLYLSPGSFCLGGGVAYPPEDGLACIEMILDSSQNAVARDIQIHYSNANRDDEKHDRTDLD